MTASAFDADRVQAIAGESWAQRSQAERHVEQCFRRIAARMRALGLRSELAEQAEAAARDEVVHARLCAELAASLGCVADSSAPIPDSELAPPECSEVQRLTYEVVAVSCVGETESCGTVLSLLKASPAARVREVLHTIATDEVRHAKLGWAYLEAVGPTMDLGFLPSLIPRMLVHAEPFFAPATEPAREADELLRWGVFPHREKRRVLAEMLREVILPGLARAGIEPAPTSEWLARHEATVRIR